MELPIKTWVIVVAAGSGTRFGTPKQFELLVGSQRVIDRAAAVAARCADGVTVVVPAGMTDLFPGAIEGGSTRSASVRVGLQSVPDDTDIICVHDAARPLADEALYRRVIEAVINGADGAVPALPPNDTIKRVDRHEWVIETPERDALRAVQTPQAFRCDVLKAAHQIDIDGSDDGVMVERVGGRVKVVSGDPRALKITHRQDLEYVRALLNDGDAPGTGDACG